MIMLLLKLLNHSNYLGFISTMSIKFKINLILFRILLLIIILFICFIK